MVLKDSFEFVFCEPPRGKERPRMCIKNGKTFVFTPRATRNYETRLAIFVEKLMRKKNFKTFPPQTPIKCEITAIYPVFKNLKRSDENFTKPAIQKPDADNVLKIIFDGLNGILYDDDAQICNIFFTKVYGEEPKIIAKFEELRT